MPISSQRRVERLPVFVASDAAAPRGEPPCTAHLRLINEESLKDLDVIDLEIADPATVELRMRFLGSLRALIVHRGGLNERQRESLEDRSFY